MRTKQILAACLTFSALASVSCGDVTSTQPISLSSAEAMLLRQEIDLIFIRNDFSRGNPSLAEVGRRGTPAISLNEQTMIAGTADCPGTGTASIAGEDDETGSGVRAFDFTVNYKACVTDHFQLDGTYHQTVTAPAVNTSVTTGTGDLTIRVLADGRSGTCHLDFTYTLASTGITATGTICGVAAS